MVLLTDRRSERGWRVRPEDYAGASIFIVYAVAAGLGQLGLNGQTLTPHASSRVRLNVLTPTERLRYRRPLRSIQGVPPRHTVTSGPAR